MEQFFSGHLTIPTCPDISGFSASFPVQYTNTQDLKGLASGHSLTALRKSLFQQPFEGWLHDDGKLSQGEKSFPVRRRSLKLPATSCGKTPIARENIFLPANPAASSGEYARCSIQSLTSAFDKAMCRGLSKRRLLVGHLSRGTWNNYFLHSL